MFKRSLIVTVISLLSLTTALAFTIENIEKVKKNMSTAQVTTIMGKPDTIVNQGMLDGKKVAVWKYGNHTEINFVGGKVESVLTTEAVSK
jgi:hypothetical protein